MSLTCYTVVFYDVCELLVVTYQATYGLAVSRNVSKSLFVAAIQYLNAQNIRRTSQFASMQQKLLYINRRSCSFQKLKVNRVNSRLSSYFCNDFMFSCQGVHASVQELCRTLKYF